MKIVAMFLDWNNTSPPFLPYFLSRVIFLYKYKHIIRTIFSTSGSTIHAGTGVIKSSLGLKYFLEMGTDQYCKLFLDENTSASEGLGAVCGASDLY